MKLNIKDPFLNRFNNQCEKIGEGGIFNVPLKKFVITDNEKYKKENLMISNKKQNNIVSKMRNHYNAITLDDYNKIPMINNKKINEIHEEKNNDINENQILFHNNNNNYISKKNKIRLEKINQKNNNSFPKNIKYNSLIISDNNKISNKNIESNERFYRPYSLKDYKNMMENYKKEKFGGLGINMNNAWKKRQKLYNKVKNFENSVYQNFNKKINDNSYRRIESPEKSELIKINQQIINSKRFLAQKYGKGLMLNKVREKIKKEKEEMNLFFRYKNQKEYMLKKNRKNIINIYDNVINNNKKNYKLKLLELKSSLI